MSGPRTWDARQYLRFEEERNRPCRDLLARVALDRGARAIDLGCGPGTSTALLAQRWPEAEVTGLDSSEEMLTVARATSPAVRWIRADLGRWTPERPFDLVLSNATLHWIPDHPRAIPRLWRWVGDGGALAFQVPTRQRGGPRWATALRELTERPRWRRRLSGVLPRSPVLSPEEYYDLLAPAAHRVDLWDTEYEHVLDGPASIVEWVKGAGMRPALDRLRNATERDRFVDDYTEAIARAYPTRPDGRVLFPFRRRFVVAYRGGGSQAAANAQPPTGETGRLRPTR